MKSFAISALLVAGANAHLDGLCACTDPSVAGQVDFIFPTYHGPPGAGSSVPGQAHIETGGVTSVFAFTTFAGTGESSSNTQEVSNRNQLIKASGIVSSGSICNCFGAKPAGAEYTPAMAPGVVSNTCGNDSWATLYKATVSGVASANYKIWTTGTDMNLDPYNGMCAFNAAAPLKIGLTVADGKDACTTAAPMGTDAEEGSGCAAGSFSGSQCVQSCPTHFLPRAGTGAPKCDDGAWVFPAATTATACYDTRFSPCSHTTCAVKNGHTVVRDWHSGEQNGNHHHCSSIVHADALNGSCRCECKSSFTESWIHHDTTGNKKSVSIASHIGAAKNDNENLPINRGANADKSRTATGHAYDTTTTTTTTTTTLAPTTTTTTTTATAAAATTTTAAAATTTTAAAATTTPNVCPADYPFMFMCAPVARMGCYNTEAYVAACTGTVDSWCAFPEYVADPTLGPQLSLGMGSVCAAPELPPQ